MHFGGFEKVDLVNYPELVAATVFVNGCNFRCPFCHNGALVMGKADDFSEEEVCDYLSLRRRMVKGVVISGGEPTLYPEIIPFIDKVKALGMKVKIDTNGSNPGMLKGLVENGRVDYVAMDIKTSAQNYQKVACHGPEEVRESVTYLLGQEKIPYEFRTTCVKDLIDPSDFLLIGQWIKGARKYVLQEFNPAHTLAPACKYYSSYTHEEMAALAARLKAYIPDIQIR